MPKNTITDLRNRLLALQADYSTEIEGALENEINELEAYANGTLPNVYRQFLNAMGRSAGGLFKGTHGFLSDKFQLRMRESAEKISKRGQSSFELPEDAFVFLMTQGYQFSYFCLGDGDDPPVYHFLEYEAKPQRLANRLSEYLLRCVENCEQRASRDKQRLAKEST